MSKVLVVDDEPSVRIMVKSMVESDDIDVLEASNGNEALEILERQDVSLVVTDIVMPEKHGIELIMEIKKKNSSAPIIAISGGGGITGRFDYLQIAKLVGAKNILKKPFSMDELRSLVKESISG